MQYITDIDRTLKSNNPGARRQSDRPVKAENRLRSRRDFTRVAKDGRRIVCPQFALSYARGDGPAPRAGFSVAGRLGGAVVRNRIRRRLREAIRPLLPSLPPVDILIVPRPAAAAASSAELRAALEIVLYDAGLLHPDRSLHNGDTTPNSTESRRPLE